MATVGIDPNTFEVLNGHPNEIPTDKILGGVVQNCQKIFGEKKLIQEGGETQKLQQQNMGKNWEKNLKQIFGEKKLIQEGGEPQSSPKESAPLQVGSQRFFIFLIFSQRNS